MINLANRTEYSFRLAYGQLDKVLEVQDPRYAGICDRHSSWGHVAFEKACTKRGIKPIFGVELGIVEEPERREKQGVHFLRFLALSSTGLQEIYALTTKATAHDHFYYFPRLGIEDVRQLSKDVVVLTTMKIDLPDQRLYLDLNQNTKQDAIAWARENSIAPMATCDNYYPKAEHRELYGVCIGRNARGKPNTAHILTDAEWWNETEGYDDDYRRGAIVNAETIAEAADVELPRAELPHFKTDKSLMEMCIEGAKKRGIYPLNKEYKERMKREVDLILDKKYEDYFYIIADLIQWAKGHMLVGPARGSSCGSLVCYLLQITDIDPIPYDLLFERFIDVNRADIPDIDIDFPDVKREQIFSYLKEKYGELCVAQLGTVSRFKAKSTIGDVAKELNVPLWEITDLKNAIIERSSGDSRAAFCIMDTFNQLDIGKKVLEKYPQMSLAGEIEAHARHTGRHAAGIVVTSKPVSNYCSVDLQTGATQVDKYDAEELNLLKIDALGLRTLSVIEDCLEQIGWTKDELLAYPLDDHAAFTILNDAKFTGIFQFEGYALQSLCHQMTIEVFEDLISLTALARPGPLNSGMATEWLKRRMGEAEVTYDHPMLKPILKMSHGVVIYQEQVMQIGREVGKMSWEDVSALRKAMSKSLGEEFFDQYKVIFIKGAVENGFTKEQATEFWEQINTFGSMGFNRSHAVSYALVSYWCLILKAHFPLEYATACLRHNKNDDQVIKLLRELHHEGYEYVAFDKDKSKKTWSVQDDIIYGGLLGVKGIADKTASDIERRRAEGIALTKNQAKKLDEAATPYDMLFECKERWGHIFESPAEHGISSKLTFLKDITQMSDGNFCFIAKLTEKNLRDMNELVNLQKRGGQRVDGQSMFLNFTVEDDTDSIICNINRWDYAEKGKPIVEEGKLGDWYVFKGYNRKGFRKIYVKRWKKLT